MKKRYCNTHEALVPTDTGLFCDQRLMQELIAEELRPEPTLAICETSTVFVVPIDDPERVQLAQRLLDAYTP